MNSLDDVVNVVLDLMAQSSEQPLPDRLAAAQRVRSELPAEPAHVRHCLDNLILASESAASGMLLQARARLPSAAPLIEFSPVLGRLIAHITAADPERTGETHDLLVRLLEPARSGTAPPGMAAIILYDIAVSAMLADVLPPTGEVNDSLWRASVLFSVGRPDAAVEMLTHLLQHGTEDVRKTLERSQRLIENCVLGRPEVAQQLLDTVIPRLRRHTPLSSETLASLVLLIDASSDEGRAQALLQQIGPSATEEDFVAWCYAASESEFQRAAAAFACAGLAATGQSPLRRARGLPVGRLRRGQARYRYCPSNGLGT